jgi:hypothetical protein
MGLVDPELQNDLPSSEISSPANTDPAEEANTPGDADTEMHDHIIIGGSDRVLGVSRSTDAIARRTGEESPMNNAGVSNHDRPPTLNMKGKTARFVVLCN